MPCAVCRAAFEAVELAANTFQEAPAPVSCNWGKGWECLCSAATKISWRKLPRKKKKKKLPSCPMFQNWNHRQNILIRVVQAKRKAHKRAHASATVADRNLTYFFARILKTAHLIVL